MLGRVPSLLSWSLLPAARSSGSDDRGDGNFRSGGWTRSGSCRKSSQRCRPSLSVQASTASKTSRIGSGAAAAALPLARAELRRLMLSPPPPAHRLPPGAVNLVCLSLPLPSLSSAPLRRARPDVPVRTVF